MKKKILNNSFFADDPVKVAPKLLGKYIVRKRGKNLIIGKIVETESYRGKGDLACHACRFGYTKKTKTLFEKPGTIYVYPVHINMYCFNVISHKDKDEESGGVLIRAVEPIKGIEIMAKLRKKQIKKEKDIINLTNGPSKFCMAFDITRKLNALSLSKNYLYITEGEKISKKEIEKSPRKNIPYAEEAKDFLWRFFIKNNKFVSK